MQGEKGPSAKICMGFVNVILTFLFLSQFRQFTDQDITRNYPHDDILINVGRVALALTLLLSFPLLIFPCRAVINRVWKLCFYAKLEHRYLSQLEAISLTSFNFGPGVSGFAKYTFTRLIFSVFAGPGFSFWKKIQHPGNLPELRQHASFRKLPDCMWKKNRIEIIFRGLEVFGSFSGIRRWKGPDQLEQTQSNTMTQQNTRNRIACKNTLQLVLCAGEFATEAKPE